MGFVIHKVVHRAFIPIQTRYTRTRTYIARNVHAASQGLGERFIQRYDDKI